MALIECVPNISEGRDPATIRAIADAMRTAPGARVLHVDSDADHHRSVITVAGSPFAVAEAAFFCAREAAARIDLSRHDGVHPRHGAVDVVPFVPLTGATMAQCVAAARTVGARIRDELGLPVQYYGHACPDATSLPELRRRERPPGSVAVGARPPLIAFNVNLDSQDVDVARSIATAIRESDGGLPAVRALGFELTRRGCVQVALNLVDWTRTSPARAYAEIERLAREAGVAIRASEVVGMIPRGAVAGTFRDALECERLEILETDETFLDALAADSSTPAGGAAAAHTGAVAAALVSMGAGTARRAADSPRLRALQSDSEALRSELSRLAREDGEAFTRYLETKEEADLHRATEIPLEIAQACTRVQALARHVLDVAPEFVRVDVRGAVHFAKAAADHAVTTAEANLRALGDTEFARRIADELAALDAEG